MLRERVFEVFEVLLGDDEEIVARRVKLGSQEGDSGLSERRLPRPGLGSRVLPLLRSWAEDPRLRRCAGVSVP